MTAQLLLMNVPYNCSDLELQEWIQSSGVDVASVRLVQDLVSGSCTAARSRWLAVSATTLKRSAYPIKEKLASA